MKSVKEKLWILRRNPPINLPSPSAVGEFMMDTTATMHRRRSSAAAATKSVAEKLRIFHWKPPINLSSPPAIEQFRMHTTATTNTRRTSASLTDDELKQINAVVPRLSSSNHLKEAVRLISAALWTSNPPLCSLPLSTITNKLALEPDLTLAMHFLNSLKHHPSTGNPNVILPIAKMLVSSFFRNGRPKRAVKVFQWVSRPDFPGEVAADLEFYAVLVDGLCKHGMILDSIRVLRAMAIENLTIGDEIGMAVYRGLLREARVREALGLHAALRSCTLGSDGGTFVSMKLVDLGRCTLRSNGGTFGSNQFVEFLDQIIADWAE